MLGTPQRTCDVHRASLQAPHPASAALFSRPAPSQSPAAPSQGPPPGPMKPLEPRSSPARPEWLGPRRAVLGAHLAEAFLWEPTRPMSWTLEEGPRPVKKGLGEPESCRLCDCESPAPGGRGRGLTSPSQRPGLRPARPWDPRSGMEWGPFGGHHCALGPMAEGRSKLRGLSEHHHILEESYWGPAGKERSSHKLLRVFLGEHQNWGDSFISFCLFFPFASEYIFVLEI